MGIGDGISLSLKGNDIEMLQNIAKMAYGNGTNEGRNGGNGNIGLLNGRVVKFNTHAGERFCALFRSANYDEKKACDNLRICIAKIAYRLLGDDSAKILEELGIKRMPINDKEDYWNVTSTKLLDRKIVAGIITEINNHGKEKITQDLWEGTTDNSFARDFKSEDSMSFASVQNKVKNFYKNQTTESLKELSKAGDWMASKLLADNIFNNKLLYKDKNKIAEMRQYYTLALKAINLDGVKDPKKTNAINEIKEKLEIEYQSDYADKSLKDLEDLSKKGKFRASLQLARLNRYGRIKAKKTLDAAVKALEIAENEGDDAKIEEAKNNVEKAKKALKDARRQTKTCDEELKNSNAASTYYELAGKQFKGTIGISKLERKEIEEEWSEIDLDD